MSTFEEAIEITSVDAASKSATSRWQRIGDLLERAGEWLNPLLVKECRQALKSRQFALTFTLVLVLCWMWSIARLAWLGPDAAYQFAGPELFYGYYFILSLALLLVVPYSAFRSLIAEQEDNTFELVAITNLRPRQIVGGKLGSAVVQMLVYFSAIAPCLAFTYLLRGIDVLTICFVLFYTFLASLGFSLAALFFATIAKEKHWQIIISVAIIVGLFSAFGGALELTYEILRFPSLSFHDVDFWLGNLAFLTLYVSTFAIIYLAAGAQLTFTADNRSRPLRIAMLVQHALFAGWVGFMVARFAISQQEYEIIPIASMVYMTIAMLYWYVMGAFMSGEATELSLRVQRGLPKSFLGRAFFTWFNPGPGTGFMFAVANAAAAGILAAVGVWYCESVSTRVRIPVSAGQFFQYSVVTFCYLVVYLGCTNLLLRLLRRVMHVTLALGVLLNGLVLVAGVGIPLIVHMSTDQFNGGYSLLHITNPFWSSGLAIENSINSPTVYAIVALVLPAAAIVFILNLLFVVPSVQQVRIAKPERVAEEDEAIAAALKPMAVPPSNPWDE